jgi:hypothetical protein
LADLKYDDPFIIIYIHHPIGVQKNILHPAPHKSSIFNYEGCGPDERHEVNSFVH